MAPHRVAGKSNECVHRFLFVALFYVFDDVGWTASQSDPENRFLSCRKIIPIPFLVENRKLISVASGKMIPVGKGHLTAVADEKPISAQIGKPTGRSRARPYLRGRCVCLVAPLAGDVRC